jgi:hypothetical protein
MLRNSATFAYHVEVCKDKYILSSLNEHQYQRGVQNYDEGIYRNIFILVVYTFTALLKQNEVCVRSYSDRTHVCVSRHLGPPLGHLLPSVGLHVKLAPYELIIRISSP